MSQSSEDSTIISRTTLIEQVPLLFMQQPQNLILFYQTYGFIFHFWWSIMNIKNYFGKWLGSWVFLIKHWYN